MVCARLWSGFGALAESCGSPTWDLATDSLYALKHPQKRVLHEPQPKRLLFLNSGGIRMRVLPLLLGIAIVVAGIPQASQAMARAKLMSCKDIQSSDLGSQGRGLVPISCMQEFSVTDPYIVLIIDVQNIDFETGLSTEVLDPGSSVIHAKSFTIKPPPGNTWAHYWLYFVLPLSATTGQLAKRGLGFLFSTVGTKAAPPISERLGEWSFIATLTPGSPVTHKFTLRP